MWDYAILCRCSSKCKDKHVPVFTGISTTPSWPPQEDYCKSMLMIHSKEIWIDPKDLLVDQTEEETVVTHELENGQLSETLIGPYSKQFLMY